MDKEQLETDDFELEQEQGDSPFFVHMLAGSCAGLMEHVAIFPIDTIKVNELELPLDTHSIKQDHFHNF